MREQHPEAQLSVLSQPFARPFFEAIEGVHFIEAEIHNRHKGILGLWRLARKLEKENSFTAIADVHSVLRSWLLTFFLCLLHFPRKYRIATINKGRKEKEHLTRAKAKQLVPLEHSVKRYADVLQRLTFKLQIPYELGGLEPVDLPPAVALFFTLTRPRVGIAPFAKHKGKIYPLERTLELVKRLQRQGIQVFLFGSQGDEQHLLERWATKPDIVVIPTYHLNLLEELSVMQRLDLMVAMDSANMHLASWAGTRVLSIWGATHRFAGFYGWGQSENLAVERDDIACRPCSIYGNKPCMRGDYACLDLSVDEIYKRVLLELPTHPSASFSN
jgi:glycosyl transferase family 9